jgi:hypothetical protein
VETVIKKGAMATLSQLINAKAIGGAAKCRPREYDQLASCSGSRTKLRLANDRWLLKPFCNRQDIPLHADIRS